MSSDAVIFMLVVVYWVISSILGRHKKKAQKEALKRQESASTPAASPTSAPKLSSKREETISQIAKALGIYVPQEVSPLPPPTYYEPVSEEKQKPKSRQQVAEKERSIPRKSAQDKKKTVQYSVKQKTRRVKLSLSQVKKDLHLQPQLKKAVIFKTILDPPPSAYRRHFTH